ncbi:DUF1592 domain-containing protein [Crateriforma conspicua]|nr:DUF1592 domain-containing protein [Crateriforma conspicua]
MRSSLFRQTHPPHGGAGPRPSLTGAFKLSLRFLVLVLVLGGMAAVGYVGRAESSANETMFRQEVAPILARHCIGCHDASTAEAGLDLSHRDAALRGGHDGVVIVEGQADHSALWQVIDADLMPPDRPPLTDTEKAVIRRWINNGASWTIDFVDPAIYSGTPVRPQQWVRRLTVDEYVHTVADVFGVDVQAQAARLLPADPRADGFRNTAYSLNVDLKNVQAYARLAEQIVDSIPIERFAKQFHRGTKFTDKDMRGLIDAMGRHVYRGPLNESEIASLRGITTTVAAAGGTYEEAVRYVLLAMLQSPRFLYRIEQQVVDGARGKPGVAPERSVAVSDFEMASRLSYAVWGGPPDKRLFDLASKKRLHEREVVETEVRRMLDDPRARRQSLLFASQWLDLDRLANLSPDQKRFPKWQAALADDMRRETLAFFEEVVWNRRRPMVALLNEPVTFVTPRLADHYDLAVDVPADDDQALKLVSLVDVPQRGGLLTQGSLLTIGGDDASMVTRGLFVLNDLLYSRVGDPPPGLDTTPIPPSPGRSHRDIALDRVRNDACGGCHAKFEPLAFGLERYDGLGTYRLTDEYGNENRQDGAIQFPGDAMPTPFDDSAQMMDLLARSDRVSKGITRKLIQFVMGRPLTMNDVSAVDQIHQAALAEGGTYMATMIAIATSDLMARGRADLQSSDSNGSQP